MSIPQARPASSDPKSAQSGAAAGDLRARVRAKARWPRAAEQLTVLLLGLLVLVVHDVGYLLRQPFWNDESWVAVTSRFPLSQLPAVTSSTPVGWSALMRLLTVSGEQTARLLPLAFAGGAVMIAYWLGRGLGWPRREESVAAGLLAGTALLVIGVYEAFDARAAVPGLTAYWRSFYLPVSQGLPAGIRFATAHFSAAGAYFGLGPAWVALPLVLVGLVTIARLGRPATALTVAALWPEMVAISAAHKYPFLDLRTSTFLFAVTASVAAIGVAGACSLLRPWLRGTLAAGLAALAVAGFVIQAQPYIRSHLIPREDVRDQALYVAAHAARGDVILVNLNGNWGFAYYWPDGVPARRADAAVLQGYEAYFPDQPDIVVAHGRDSAGVEAALSRAIAREHACSKIWLVRTHMTAAEQHSWTRALHLHRMTTTPVGHAGLNVINDGGPRCR